MAEALLVNCHECARTGTERTNHLNIEARDIDFDVMLELVANDSCV